jgi:hypothetical protein
MTRWPLLALPVLTVAVVALAILTAAAPRPYRVARVWGGPTDGETMAMRLEMTDLVESRGEVAERPVAAEPALVRLWTGNFEASRRAVLDAEGDAEVTLSIPASPSPLTVAVGQDGKELALGRVRLERARWAKAARRRGGWVTGTAGDYSVRIAPERGALAVPFEEGLWVEVERKGTRIAGATVALAATGARVSPEKSVTDVRGRARFSIAPEEHTLGVRVTITEGELHAEVAFGLPVVPGALRARLLGADLVIEAPVPRDVAYVALVNENGRLFGGRVALTPDRSGASARVRMPELAVQPTHAVVASERDLRSAASVGWPLFVKSDAEPGVTFDAVDALLLDGRPQGAARENARRARVRWATVGLCAIAVLLELALLLAYTRSRDRALDSHLEREGIVGDEAARLAPARSLWFSVALAMIALGFLLLAIAAVLKLG